MKWKILSSEYISEHPYFTARKDRCENAEGKIIDPYFVVEMPSSVCAVALTETGKVLMVKQYRHPIAETIIELSGGFVDKGESAKDAMIRELKEETGYEFSSVIPVGKIAANPGVLNNFTHLFLAQGGVKTSDLSLDENEDIAVEIISLDELKSLFLRNKIVQALHNTCIFYALKSLGKL